MGFGASFAPSSNQCRFFMHQACDLRKPLAIGKKAINQPLEAQSGGVKGGADGIGGHLLQFAGNNGGEQETLQFCTLRLGGIAMAPTPLAYAVIASNAQSRAR